MRRRIRFVLGFLVAALAGPIPARALTLSEIRTQVRYNVRDTATSGNRYSDAILTGFVNEAQKEFSNLTWCVEKSTSYALTAGTTYYAMPADFIATRLAVFTDTAGVGIKMEEISRAKLYQDNPGYETFSPGGPPSQFYTRYTGDGTADTMQIAYLPVPTATSTGTVTVFYVAQPVDLASDSDVPFEGYDNLLPYQYALVAHVTARIKIIEAKTAEADFYMKQFDRLVQIAQARFNSLPGYNPSVQAAPR